MYYIDYKGKKYPARDIDNVPNYENEGTVTVADYILWLDMEEDYNKGDKEANELDDEIFAYVEPGYLEKNPTDDELRENLKSFL